jgi:hypothetical protein
VLTQEDVEAKLRTTQVKVDFRADKLSAVLEYLSREADVEFVLDARTFEDEEVSLDVPVTLKLRKSISAWDALHLTLRLTATEQLNSLLRHGGVVVTTETRAASHFETRVYDCRDLLPKTEPENDCQAFGPQAPSVPGNPTSPNPEIRLRDDDLISAIAQVQAESWGHSTGHGNASEFRGALIVLQTQAVHRGVRKLLVDMRDVLKHEPGARIGEAKSLDANLDHVLASANWTEVDLRDVLADLSNQVQVDFVLDEHCLKDEGVDSSEPVTLKINRPVTVRDALHLILEPLQLGVVEYHDVLLVSTATQLGSILDTRIYDCRSLLTKGSEAELLGQLAQLLTSSIDPDTWPRNHQIPLFRGMLIVEHTAGVHRQIKKVLQDLDRTLQSDASSLK